MSKQCPHCKELSPDNFEKCQWCAKRFDEPGANITEESLQSKNPIATKTDATMQKNSETTGFNKSIFLIGIIILISVVIIFRPKSSKSTFACITFCFISIMSAIYFHTGTKKYIYASLKSAIASSILFQIIGFFIIGYLDPFFIIALLPESVLALIIALLIGLPFLYFRKKLDNGQGLIVNNLAILEKKKTFGLGSIMLSISGWLWFVVCFTAKEAKWWNSLWFFLLIFIFAISLGIIGRRSIGGILGIIVGGLGLLVVTFGLYVG
ncbi:MAG: hypothetical protein WC947_08125 [Elusimicrobiota bacterium]